jgi:hypothetical protein
MTATTLSNSRSAGRAVDTGLVDFAGVDGLQFAIALFGPAANRIAPFQSMSVELAGQSGVLLRLCENNFRLRWMGESNTLLTTLNEQQGDRQLWIRALPWLGAIAYPPDAITAVLDAVTPTPPHQVSGLSIHRAAVGRVDGRSVLVWLHDRFESPMLELHAAIAHLPDITASLV